MPFALASSFVTAAFLVLHPASFNRPSLHFITFHSLIHAQAPSVGLLQSTHIHSCKATTSLSHCLRKAHYSPFRYIQSSFPQQAAVHRLPLLCSPALVVRAAGCHAFCILALLADTQSDSFQQPTAQKQKITPALARAATHTTRQHMPWPYS